MLLNILLKKYIYSLLDLKKVFWIDFKEAPDLDSLFL